MKLKTIVILAICVGLAACAKAPVAPPVGVDAPGFWWGLLHGIILPFAWIGSLFDSSIGIYATVNNGGWYDFGFALGACSSVGASASSTRR